MRPLFPRFLTLAVTCVCTAITATALPGQVSIRNGIVQWGQYNNLKYVIAVGTSADPLATSIRDYPASGASCVLLHAQRPGRPLFSPDGGTMDPAQRSRLIEDIRTVNTLDMLPVVVLFSPDKGCHLESPVAYARAAASLSALVKEEKLWYLPCIVTEGASGQWGKVDVPGVVQQSASAIRGVLSTQVIAAGSSDANFNRALFDGDSAIHVLAARPGTPGTLTPVGDHPVIELMPADAARGEILANALTRAYKTPIYGFAIDLNDGASQLRERTLNDIFILTDAYHKATWKAVPPDAGDTHSLKPGEAGDGFKSLFNGENLNGWVQLTSPGNFEVRDGAIELIGKSGGWLRSWEVYGDFTYRAEYWIEEGGNAGFYIRAPAIGRQSRIGFEFQIMGQPASLEPRKDTTGAIYDVRPPAANHMKLNDWNEVEITCQGSRVHIVWNGHLIHDFHYEDEDFMKSRAHRGFIGLQDHQSSVKYRNLRIKRLD